MTLIIISMRSTIIFVLVLIISSCANDRSTSVADIVSQWEGREILFPENSVFTIRGRRRSARQSGRTSRDVEFRQLRLIPYLYRKKRQGFPCRFFTLYCIFHIFHLPRWHIHHALSRGRCVEDVEDDTLKR